MSILIIAIISDSFCGLQQVLQPENIIKPVLVIKLNLSNADRPLGQYLPIRHLIYISMKALYNQYEAVLNLPEGRVNHAEVLL
jgi:hypothetical protein